jgi:hypothetical protein
MPTLQRGATGRNYFKLKMLVFITHKCCQQPLDAIALLGVEYCMMNVQTLAFVGFGLAWAAILAMAWYQHYLPLLPVW